MNHFKPKKTNDREKKYRNKEIVLVDQRINKIDYKKHK